MIIDMNYYKKVAKRLLMFILTLFILYIFFKLSIFYVPFLIAFIISLIIEPIIRKIMKITNLTRKASAVITLIIVFSLIIGLSIWGITGLISEASNILGDMNNIVQNITFMIQETFNNIKLDSIKIPEQLKEIIMNAINSVIGEGSNIAEKLLTRIIDTVKNIPQILICTGITILATYFVCTDKMYILDQMEHHLPRSWVEKVGIKTKKVISSLGNYLKAQSTLILISFIIVLIGLLIFNFIGMNVSYPIIMALLIGFIDALPILGSGTIMIPWAIISASYGDIKLAIALIILYIIIIIIRQLIEPKIVSNNIGIHPIFTLISMYTGFKLIGIIRNVCRTNYINNTR